MTCQLPVVYDDDRWTHIVTQAEEDCVAYVAQQNLIPDRLILDVGIGASHCYKTLGTKFTCMDGIAVMDSEIKYGLSLVGPNSGAYFIHKINKYDVSQLKQLGLYSCIIDVNPKMFGCCQKHWQEYFSAILTHIWIGGEFVTHTAGFGCYADATGQVNCSPLTLQEMVQLIPAGYSFQTIESSLIPSYSIVVVKRHV
jgi:hypothetical protein